MEVRPRANLLTLLLYRATAFRLHRIQRFQIGEMLVDQRFIAQRPQTLGRLQLRRIGRQIEHVQPFLAFNEGLCHFRRMRFGLVHHYNYVSAWMVP